MGPHDPAERGAADISFVAPYVPGLDGLGAMGSREHAPDEHVRLDKLPMLIRRAALLIHRLLELPRDGELPPPPEWPAELTEPAERTGPAELARPAEPAKPAAPP